MPITFKNAQATAGTSTVTLAMTFTVSTGEVLIVGAAHNFIRSVSAMAYNGVALAQVGRVLNTANLSVAVWILTAPAAGSFILSARFAGASETWILGAVTYEGVKNVGGFGTVASATQSTTAGANFSLSINATGFGVAFIAGNVNTSNLNGGTLRLRKSAFPAPVLMVADATGAATVSFSTSSTTTTNWSFIGVPLNFSAAAAATGVFGLSLMGCGL